MLKQTEQGVINIKKKIIPKITKKKLEAAIKDSGGILTTIAKRCVISRNTLYKYLEEHPEYKELIEQEREGILDLAEVSLFEQIKDQEPWATKFILKTLGTKRGYVERTEVDTGVDKITGDNFRAAWNTAKKEDKPEKDIVPVKPQLGDNLTIYLDIETTGLNKTKDIITVVGIYTDEQAIQLVNGINLTEDKLNNIIKRTKRIVSFNGILFDIPFLATKYPNINFTKAEHKDLRHFCKAHNLTGGLKKIERELGISRDSGVSDGKEAIELWNKHKAGCKKSLPKLLEYNREDIINLSKIEQILENMNKT